MLIKASLLPRPHGWRPLAMVCIGAALMSFTLGIEHVTPTFAASDMRDVVRTLKTQLPYWCVPLGWLAVWAMRVHSAGSVLVGPAPGRPRSDIVLTQVATLSAALVLGALIGNAPGVVKVMVTQYWTPTDLVSFAAVLIAMASLLPVAACAAAVTPPRVGLLVAPLMVLLVTLVPAFVINDQLLVNRPASVMSTAYVWSISPPARGEMLVWQVELLRILYFCLMWIVAVRISTGLAEWRASSQPRGLLSLGWLMLPLAVTMGVGYQQPILVMDDPGDHVQCASHGRLEICTYQIDDRHQEFIAEAFEPLVLLTEPDEGGRLTITQELEAAEGAPLPPQLWVVGRMRSEPEEWLDVELSSAAMVLSGATRECHDEQASILAYTVMHQLLLRAAENAPSVEVQSAYLGRLGDNFLMDPEAGSRLAALDDHEFARWFSLRREAITGCSLDRADLP